MTYLTDSLRLEMGILRFLFFSLRCFHVKNRDWKMRFLDLISHTLIFWAAKVTRIQPVDNVSSAIIDYTFYFVFFFFNEFGEWCDLTKKKKKEQVCGFGPLCLGLEDSPPRLAFEFFYEAFF